MEIDRSIEKEKKKEERMEPTNLIDKTSPNSDSYSDSDSPTLYQNLSESEVQFLEHEIFFSHTDRKGKILYGNDVFVRLSEYSFEELVGQPHNIIRHPDMPRCVFQLLWEMILSEKPIVAYVKNQTKSGKYYWVLALVFPLLDGFLSIRLKPTAPLFKKIPDFYLSILHYEKANGMDKAKALLISEIQKMGFSTYQDFMIRVLVDELGSKTHRPKTQTLHSLLSITKGIDELWDITKDARDQINGLKKEFHALHLLCLNLSTNAYKYGEKGATISTTSETFGKWGNEIQLSLDDLAKKQAAFLDSLKEVRFSFSLAHLQTDMAIRFKESANRSKDYEDTLNLISQQNLSLAKVRLSELQSNFRSYFTTVTKLGENLLAMKIIRLNSRIESVYLPDEGSLIDSTVHGISKFISNIEKMTGVIMAQSVKVKSAVETYYQEF